MQITLYKVRGCHSGLWLRIMSCLFSGGDADATESKFPHVFFFQRGEGIPTGFFSTELLTVNGQCGLPGIAGGDIKGG